MNILDSSPAEMWRQHLQRDRNNKLIANAANVVTALEHSPDLAGIIQLDRLSGKLMLVKRPPWENDSTPRVWRDSDDTELLIWLQEQELLLRGVQPVADAVRMVGRRHSYDPLSDYLNALKWDGKRRLSRWLPKYLGAADTEVNQSIGRAFLISAVARGLEPGCQVDHVLCLEGQQGAGKTEVVRALGGEWTQEHLPDMHSKDSMASLQGAWFVEISELAALSRSQIEGVKSFVSRRIDRYRPPYGRHVTDQPRRSVFVATTNEKKYLRDATGNRRFWPVACGEINLGALSRDRDQLFSEAVQAFRSGEPWHLSDPRLVAQLTAIQEQRMEHDPWLPSIVEMVDNKASITTAKILDGLGIKPGKGAAPDAKRVSTIMRKLGYVEDVSKAGGTREVVWKAHEGVKQGK